MLSNFSQTGRKFTGLVARWKCLLLSQEVSVTFPVGRMEDTDNTNAHHIYQCLLGCLAVCHIPPPPLEVLPPFDAFFFFFFFRSTFADCSFVLPLVIFLTICGWVLSCDVCGMNVDLGTVTSLHLVGGCTSSLVLPL